ncbi:MAG: beta-galactosidase, partial [Eubacteriales bacterium]|nr:beta-galactosidase [Eubacteriales bacterium]
MKATKPTLDFLYDPRVFQVNRLDAHSDHAIYAGKAEADAGQSSLTKSLDGQWKLHYAPGIDARTLGFEAADFDASGWADMPVPGCLEMNGHGIPHYVNVQYPWDGWEAIDPPAIPKKNPVAEYVTDFELPENFLGKRVVLSFDGAATALYAWVNGTFLGYAEDGFTPSHFDATELLKAGKNRLALRIFRYSTASWLEDQDFWRFTGLIRGVRLSAQPAAHVEDLFAKGLLDDDYVGGALELDVKLKLPKDRQVTVRAELADERGAEALAFDLPAEP